MLLNGVVDTPVALGLFTGGEIPVSIMIVLGAFITALHIVGRRSSLKSRFSIDPVCPHCGYNLTDNLPGRCPECGMAVAG